MREKVGVGQCDNHENKKENWAHRFHSLVK